MNYFFKEANSLVRLARAENLRYYDVFGEKIVGGVLLLSCCL